MIDIRPCTVDEIVGASTYPALIDAYAVESAIPGLPPCAPNIATYKAMEAGGILTCFGAFDDCALVGILVMTISQVPQYGIDMASIIIFYVGNQHRKGGTGKRMVEMAEAVAVDRGAAVLLMGAPSDGRLAKAAPLMGFKGSHISFSKVLI